MFKIRFRPVVTNWTLNKFLHPSPSERGKGNSGNSLLLLLLSIQVKRNVVREGGMDRGWTAAAGPIFTSFAIPPSSHCWPSVHRWGLGRDWNRQPLKFGSILSEMKQKIQLIVAALNLRIASAQTPSFSQRAHLWPPLLTPPPPPASYRYELLVHSCTSSYCACVYVLRTGETKPQELLRKKKRRSLPPPFPLGKALR